MIETKYPHRTWSNVYTDCLAQEAVRNGGEGMYIRFPDGNSPSMAVPGGILCTTFRAEALAITSAAEFLTSCGKPLEGVVIFTDSMSALQAFDSDDPDHTIQDLQSALATLTETITTMLQWVPAHVGLSGNEKANRLDKASSEHEQADIPVTYKEAKTLLGSKFQAQWTNQNSGYKAHLGPLRKLERKHQRCFD